MTVWLTPQGAADHAKIGVDLIKRAVKAGELPAYKIGTGHHYRLTADDIDNWLKARPWEPKESNA